MTSHVAVTYLQAIFYLKNKMQYRFDSYLPLHGYSADFYLQANTDLKELVQLQHPQPWGLVQRQNIRFFLLQ